MATRPLAHPILVPAIRLDHADPEGEARRALQRARAPWAAGFLLFGGEAEQVARLTDDLRDAAGRPIFVASDMERGAGQQVRGLRVLPEAGVLGLAATPAEVEAAGRITAEDARSVGVDVVFAPVLDVMSERTNPIVGHRAFGWDPARVAVLGRAFVRGVLAGGAIPVAKHFPGHGATLRDSHDEVPEVRESARRLAMRDLLPFRQALGDGLCPAVMTAHVRYPALDPSGRIATFSRRIIDHVREAAADPMDVAVFTDALCMEGAREGLGEAEAARRALSAGCDLLLYAGNEEDVAAALGDAPDAELDAAAMRAMGLMARRTLAEAAREPTPLARAASDRLVRDVARRAVDLAWWGPAETTWVLVLDDDADRPERGRRLAERGRAAGVPVSVVHVAAGELPPEEAPTAGGWTVVVMASVRSSKGAAGVSPALAGVLDDLEDGAERGGRRIRWVFLGPGSDRSAVFVPGTGPEIEDAVAARLFGHPA